MEYLGGGSALDLMKAGSLEEVNIFSQVGNCLVEWLAVMGVFKYIIFYIEKMQTVENRLCGTYKYDYS